MGDLHKGDLVCPGQLGIEADFSTSDKVRPIMLQDIPRCLDSRLRLDQRSHRGQRPQRLHRPIPRKGQSEMKEVAKPCQWCGDASCRGLVDKCKLRPVECCHCGMKLAFCRQEAHEKSCPERPISDEDLMQRSRRGVNARKDAASKRTRSSSKFKTMNADSRSSSRSSCRSMTPSRKPASARAVQSQVSGRSDTPRKLNHNRAVGSRPSKSKCKAPDMEDDEAALCPPVRSRAETPLDAENGALCMQVSSHLRAQVETCREILEEALQHCLAHPQDPVLEDAAGLEGLLTTMSQQLQLLEWASVGGGMDIPQSNAQDVATDTNSEVEKGEKTALVTVLDLQRRVDAFEAALEVLAMELAPTGQSLSQQLSSKIAAPPPAGKPPCPVAAPPATPRRRHGALDSVRRSRVQTPQSPMVKRAGGVPLSPLTTKSEGIARTASASRRPSSRSSCHSTSVPPSPCRGPGKITTASPTPQSARTRRPLQLDGQPARRERSQSLEHSSQVRGRSQSIEDSGSRAGSRTRSRTTSRQRSTSSMSGRLDRSLQTGELKAQIAEERKRFLQQRLQKSGAEGYPAPVTGQTAVVTHHNQAPLIKNGGLWPAGDVPTLEELRSEVQREREAYIGQRLPTREACDGLVSSLKSRPSQ